MGLQVYDEHAVDNNALTIDLGTGTSRVPVCYGALLGTRVNHIVCSSSALLDHSIQVSAMSDEAYVLATVNVPAGAGYTPSVPAVDLLASLPWGMQGILLGDGEDCGVQLQVALLTGEILAVYVEAGDL